MKIALGKVILSGACLERSRRVEADFAEILPSWSPTACVSIPHLRGWGIQLLIEKKLKPPQILNHSKPAVLCF